MQRHEPPERVEKQRADGAHGQEQTDEERGDRVRGRRERAHAEDDHEEGSEGEEGRETDSKEKGSHGKDSTGAFREKSQKPNAKIQGKLGKLFKNFP